MGDLLSAARSALDVAEIELTEKRAAGAFLPAEAYLRCRLALNDQWIRLAAIERGMNPFHPTIELPTEQSPEGTVQ